MSGTKIRRMKFTEQEDTQLRALVAQFGATNWTLIASHMPGRVARQCRDRWNHYLTPDRTVEQWTPGDDEILRANLSQSGPGWSEIAGLFPGHTDISVRNRCLRLGRQEDADPVRRSSAFQGQRIGGPAVPEGRELEDAKCRGGELPSCLSLLASVSAAPTATKLYPLTGGDQ